MICKICGGEMYKEEICNDTSRADIDDSFDTVWICEECGNEYNPKE